MALKYIPDIGNHPAYSYHNNLPITLYSLNSFKFMSTAPNHLANDLPETGMSERNEENYRLKDCELEAKLNLRITGIKQKQHKRIHRICENFRVVAESGGNALNFDDISHVRLRAWSRGANNLEGDNRPKMELPVLNSRSTNQDLISNLVTVSTPQEYNLQPVSLELPSQH